MRKTTFPTMPAAKKNIRQMIDMRLIELEKSEADKRIKLVRFLLDEVDDLV